MKDLLLTVLAGLTLAKSRTSPPPGCLSVGQSAGDFSTIQAAVDSLDTTTPDPQCIFVYPGTYTEQVLVPARAAQLSVYGSTPDTSGYAANTVTVTNNKSQKLNISNDETATLRIKSAGFSLYNVDVDNSFGKGSQAVAVSAYADSGYYGCAFRGFQDTLLAQTGRQVYARTLVQGATDFAFGQHAGAWFEKCDVRVLVAGVGYVTGMLNVFLFFFFFFAFLLPLGLCDELSRCIASQGVEEVVWPGRANFRGSLRAGVGDRSELLRV